MTASIWLKDVHRSHRSSRLQHAASSKPCSLRQRELCPGASWRQRNDDACLIFGPLIISPNSNVCLCVTATIWRIIAERWLDRAILWMWQKCSMLWKSVRNPSKFFWKIMETMEAHRTGKTGVPDKSRPCYIRWIKLCSSCRIFHPFHIEQTSSEVKGTGQFCQAVQCLARFQHQARLLKDVRLTYRAVGSSTGQREFTQVTDGDFSSGLTDFAAGDIPMDPSALET